jgi:DNA repair protein RadA/Sms
MVILGEVGLSGEIRSVSQVTKRLGEAKKLGFKRAIGPKFGATAATRSVSTVEEAITSLFSK